MRSLFSPYLALDRRLWLLTLARCINVMGFSVVMPFMALYLVELRGFAGKTYGALYFAAGIVAAFSNAQAGALADEVGRKRVMVRALVWRALNMLGLGAAVQLHAPLPVLALLILMNGFLRARVEPAMSAAVTDHTSAKTRVAAFGLQRVGINLGWALGPALGGAFVHGTYGLLFCVASPLLLLAAWAVSKVDDVQRVQSAQTSSEAAAFDRGSMRAAFANRPFVWYLVLTFFSGVLTNQMFSTLSLYARLVRHLSEHEVGLIYTVNGLLVVVLQVPGVWLIRRFGPKLTLSFGPGLYALGFIAFGSARSFWQMAAVTAIITLGEVLFAPAQNDMAAELGDKARMGRAFGLYGFASSLGVSIAPLFGGAMYDAFQTQPLRLWGGIGGAMALLCAAYTLFALRLRPREPILPLS